jgi:catechol 2,3-dioxygenase-like lactoylglutathione lyase family enzyme
MTAPRGIGQIHISVTDLARSVAWYRDVLGLPFLFEFPGMAFFDCGGVRLYLGIPEDESFRSRPVVYYRVDDVEAACQQITARGGEFGASPHLVHRDDAHELWMASLTDPDGIPVVLMEERPLAIGVGA